MSRIYALAAMLVAMPAWGQNSGANTAVTSLPEIRRIYVSELTGAQADEMRSLLISSLAATKLFLLTDNPDRADAIVKGAADDHAFIDTHDIQEGIGSRQNSGGYGSSSAKSSSRLGGGYGGLSISDSKSYHSRERKHEAYAALRLCNRDGDVIWSTTQESQGAKFRGASADVAAKVAKQLALDTERARRDGSIDPSSTR